MAAPYEEVTLSEMTWDKELQAYVYECPCGDLFQITLDELAAGEDIARCPSCSLFLLVRYSPEEVPSAPPAEPTQPQPAPVSVA